MSMLSKVLLVAALLFGSVGLAMADDWTAVRLRGQVLQLVDGQWQKLGRGDVVPDSRAIRTLKNGNVQFQRGNETITVGANSAIQIYDENRAKPFTTVKQKFGTVAIEADVRQVQHFAVETPYLAAVVKGTRFVVTSDDKGASVAVQRGHVYVEDMDDHSSVTITVGQSASVSETAPDLMVAGRGTLPQVVDANGKPVAAATDTSKGSKTSSSSAGSGNNGNSNAGSGGGTSGASVSVGTGNNGDGNTGNGNGNSAGVSLSVSSTVTASASVGTTGVSVSVGGGNGGDNNGHHGEGNNGNGNGNGGSLVSVEVGPISVKLL